MSHALTLCDMKSRPPRNMLSLSLPEEALEALDKESKAAGMTKKETTTRLFLWFHAQDEGLKAVILQRLSGPPARALMLTALEKLAKVDQAKGTK